MECAAGTDVIKVTPKGCKPVSKDRCASGFMASAENVTFPKDPLETCCKCKEGEKCAYCVDEECESDDEDLCQFVPDVRPAHRRLLSIQECPEYFKDNVYILSGYRPPGLPPLEYLKSIFQVHNDAFNVWSHLFGALLFIVLLPYTITFVNEQSNDPTKTGLDVSAFSVFLVGGFLMFSCSAVYHVFWPLSETTALTCAKIDYMGIVFMIWGSYYPFIRFLFYDDASMYVRYSWSLIAVAVACGCALFPSYMQKPRYRWIRQLVFWGLGSVIPVVIVQGMYKYGASSREMKLYGYPLLYGCVVYLVGSVLFAMQAPEKYLPGRCDKCGSSHNIMHVCVIIASLMHYTWFLESFKLRNSESQQ